MTMSSQRLLLVATAKPVMIISPRQLMSLRFMASSSLEFFCMLKSTSLAWDALQDHLPVNMCSAQRLRLISGGSDLVCLGLHAFLLNRFNSSST